MIERGTLSSLYLDFKNTSARPVELGSFSPNDEVMCLRNYRAPADVVERVLGRLREQTLSGAIASAATGFRCPLANASPVESLVGEERMLREEPALEEIAFLPGPLHAGLFDGSDAEGGVRSATLHGGGHHRGRRHS